MTCRISHFQDGRSFQQNPLVSLVVDLYAWNDGGKSSLANGNITYGDFPAQDLQVLFARLYTFHFQTFAGHMTVLLNV